MGWRTKCLLCFALNSVPTNLALSRY